MKQAIKLYNENIKYIENIIVDKFCSLQDEQFIYYEKLCISKEVRMNTNNYYTCGYK